MTDTRVTQPTNERRSSPASNLLVPLDGTELSGRALPVAAALGERLGASISVVDCLPPRLRVENEERWVAEQLAVLEGPAVEPTVHATAHIVADLLATASSTPGTVLCLATHGRSGVAEVVMGSIARRLILESPDPVVVVGPASRVPDRFGALQVCFDGSPDSGPTLDAAISWARALGATPWLTHVVDEVDLSAVSPPGDVAMDSVVFGAAARLRAAGLEPEWDVLHGRHRADALASWATAHGSDLLVVGCHARSVVDRLLGTITTRLLHIAPCPVLVVGPNVVAR